MNLYITGLNQITDVEIDKINKPNLPIAAGLLSRRQGIVIVVLALISSLWMGQASLQWGTVGLNWTLWCSGILGTLYSLPPFRLKRFPVLAAICIVAVRGGVINAGFYAHAQVAAFGRSSMGVTTAAAAIAGATGSSSSSIWHFLQTDPKCLLSSLFFAMFGIVIALMKDVPDVKGDATANIRTFSVRLGPQRMFRSASKFLSLSLLLTGLAFSKGALCWVTSTSQVASLAVRIGRGIVGMAALASAWSVERQAALVNPDNPHQVYQFYMHLWKLFYLSYLVLPFAR
jgi:homogentisate phytyltransferase / homogentisate geranylgeranyltransferase